jgi:type I restriction enzyme S subunit
MNIVPVPNSSVLKVFCDQIRVIFEYHHSLQEQSRTLAQTRDALLPKLISGEVRVDEVEDVETL